MAPAWAWLLIALMTAIVYGFRPHWIWRVRHLPGPWPAWMTGNMLSIRKKGSHIYHQELAEKYGPIFKTFGLGQPYVVITSPQLIRETLLHSAIRIKLASMDVPDPEFDEAGILFARGEHWRFLRSAWAPMFFTGSLEIFAGLMNTSASKLNLRLGKAADSGETINVWRYLGDMTMDVVGAAAFGLDLHTQTLDGTLAAEDAQQVMQLREDVVTLFASSFGGNSLWFLPTVLFPELAPSIRWLASKFPDQAIRTARKAQLRMIKLTTNLVTQHRANIRRQAQTADQLANGHPNGEQAGKEGGQKPKSKAIKFTAQPGSTADLRKGVQPGSFIDILVRQADEPGSAKHLTDVTIASQAYTVILAGYETTANTLAFAIYNLALNPGKAAKLMAEIDAQQGEPSYQAQEKMVYADAVIRETLRLYPTGAAAIRETTKDTILGGYKIPKGTNMIASFWAMHRNESLWPGANEFQPERWLDDSPKAVEQRQMAWKAFGDGARGCPGWRFAVEEAKIALYHMFKDFSFTLAPGQQPLALSNTITLSPKTGVFVQVQRRAKGSQGFAREE